MVVGNDVVALFPSMKENSTGEAVSSQGLKGDMKHIAFDYREIARYCAINRKLCGDLSEVENLLPRRMKEGMGGCKPGMQNSEVKGKRKGGEKTWTFPKIQPTERQNKVLEAKMAQIGVRTIFTNFMYEFGGEKFIQGSGGPIGARVTMAAARLVMQEWSEAYRKILEDSGAELDAHGGYVDDGRQATSLMLKGSRFVPELKRFAWRADWEEEDIKEDLPDEVRMANIC